jgi:hypothetical protein
MNAMLQLFASWVDIASIVVTACTLLIVVRR